MHLDDPRGRIRAHLLTSAEVEQLAAETCLEMILAAAEMIAGAFGSGRKLLLCGNGGSAANAQHIAAEFTSGLMPKLRLPALPAIALTTDTSFLTAHANDFGFEYVFRRQVEALGSDGDVLMALSTSGNSENVVQAVEACLVRGIRTVGLLGGQGGQLRSLVDLPILAPSHNTHHIQEAHIAIGHIVSELVTSALFSATPSWDGLVCVEAGRS
jgi:D-sedoheptulose 7-phosphate isomerase